jgi:hypothetical protein
MANNYGGAARQQAAANVAKKPSEDEVAALPAEMPEGDMLDELIGPPGGEDMSVDAAVGGMPPGEQARLEQIAAGYGKTPEEVADIVSIVQEFMGAGADMADMPAEPAF